MNALKNRRIVLQILLLLSSLMLVACGGGSSGSADTGDQTETSTPDSNTPAPGNVILTGVFLDAPVSGLNYRTVDVTGTTNANGEFNYKQDQVVTFKLGNITLGSSKGKAKVTTLDLVPDTNDVNNVRVSNLNRLLQSLDTDDNPANGIVLSPAAISAADAMLSDIAHLDQLSFESNNNIATLLSAAGKTFVDAGTAASHFKDSLNANSITFDENNPLASCKGKTCSIAEACFSGSCLPVSEFNTACLGVTCAVGDVCYGGACFDTVEFVDACQGVTCTGTNICIAGACSPSCGDGQCEPDVADACDGVSCITGETCVSGACFPVCNDADGNVITDDNGNSVCFSGAEDKVDELCVGITCSATDVCVSGVCFPSCGDDDVCFSSAKPAPCAGVTCAEGDVCYGGACFPDCSNPGVCASGETASYDSASSGNCGGTTVCASNEICSDGSCVEDPCNGVICGSNMVCYGGACFDLCDDSGTNPNCYNRPNDACNGVSCSVGDICYGGACFPVCDGSGTNPNCYNKPNDACNGVSCNVGDICYGGACFPVCDGSVTNSACFSDADKTDICEGVSCAEGNVCFGGACFLDLSLLATCNGVLCSPGQSCFASACVDTSTVIEACTGVSCGANESCHAGQCFSEASLGDACTGVVCNGSDVCYAGACFPTCPPSSNSSLCGGSSSSDNTGVRNSSFNSTGLTTISSTSALTGFDSDEGRAITRDANNNIYVTGTSLKNTNRVEMALWKYTEAGVLDTTFNTTGYVTYGNVDGFFEGNAIALDSNGNVFVAGTYAPVVPISTASDYKDLAVWKFKADGSLDTTFASNGILIFGQGENERATALAIDSGDNIYIAGFNDSNSFIIKVNNDGFPDAGFGINDTYCCFSSTGGGELYAGVANGIVILENNEVIFGIAVDSTGKVYATGKIYDDATSTAQMVLVRLNTDGSLDAGFDSDGQLLAPHPFTDGKLDQGNAIVIDADDNVFITGQASNVSYEGYMTIWKYNSTGVLDTSFDSNGIVTMSKFGSGAAIALDDIGGVYVTGNIDYANMQLWKYTAAGALDTAFDTNGLLTEVSNDGSSDTSSRGLGVVIDSNNKLYVTGFGKYAPGENAMTIWSYE